MLLLLCVLLGVVTATKLEISTIKENFNPGENITLKVSIYDDENNLINDNIDIVIEDADKRKKIEKTISSNKLEEIDLGKSAPYGFWTVSAEYQDAEAKAVFSVEMNEEARFELNGDKLTVINVGNTRYSKEIQILIGSSIGKKNVELEPGETISFRLIAPDGSYSIKITDGKTTLTESDVALTGKVVGVLDERLTTGSSPVTGGVRPAGEEESFYKYLKNKKFIYVFLLVIIGAAVLLAVERNIRKKYK